jgi:hypothetical protein
MRITRGALAATTATLAALTLWATPAHADIAPPQPFYADSISSFDHCPHGITSGTLLWATPGPLAPVAVNISGQVVDRPTLDGAVACTPDDYNSTATFTAYSGSKAVASASVTVDNGTKQFQFSLGGSATSTSTPLTSLTVQVCRNPVHTLPPSYCGKTATYTP